MALTDKESIAITGVHLVRIGDHAIVSVEIFGHWVEIIKETIDGPFSHISEVAGIKRAAGMA